VASAVPGPGSPKVAPVLPGLLDYETNPKPRLAVRFQRKSPDETSPNLGVYLRFWRQWRESNGVVKPLGLVFGLLTTVFEIAFRLFNLLTLAKIVIGGADWAFGGA